MPKGILAIGLKSATEQEVVDLQYLINDFSLVRNKYIGIIKALEAKGFQINNIVKLRAAGLEDISL